jgi:thioredoxin 1
MAPADTDPEGEPPMSHVTVTDSNFDKEVIEAPELTLVDFWAPWCMPCRQLAPIIDELATEYKGRLKVGKLNVDEAGAAAARYGIKSIPTVILFRGGKVVKSVVGVQPKDYFVRLIEEIIAG